MANTRSNSGDNAKRLNLALPERTIERIERIRDLTTASSATDVIKTALLTYEALVEFASEGHKFFVKKSGEQNFTAIKFLFDVDHRKTSEPIHS